MRKITLFLALIMLCGCAKPKPIPPPQMATYPLSAYNAERVRSRDVVEVFEVGRRVVKVPGTGGETIMVEGGRAYRVAKSARWNLAPNGAPLAGKGSIGGYVPPTVKPLPVALEQRQILDQQQEILAALEQSKKNLDAQRTSMNEQLAKLQGNVAAISTLQAQLDEQKRINRQLQEKVDEAQAAKNDPAKTDELKNFSIPSAPVKK